MKSNTGPPNNLDRIRQYGKEMRRDANSLAFALMADAFRDEGMLSEAEEVCRKGIEQHPSYATARVVMGQIHEDLGDVGSAQQEYEAALSLDPQNIMARMSLGNIFLRGDRRGEARAHFEHVLFLNPTHEKARYLLDVADGSKPFPEDEGRTTRETQAPQPEPASEPQPDPATGHRELSVDEIESTVRRLSEVPGVLAAMLVERDGLLIASERNTLVDEEAFGALVSEIGGAMARCAVRMGMGKFERSVIEGATGRVVLRQADSRVLVVAAEDGARLGMVNMLMDQGAARLENSPSSSA